MCEKPIMCSRCLEKKKKELEKPIKPPVVETVTEYGHSQGAFTYVVLSPVDWKP